GSQREKIFIMQSCTMNTHKLALKKILRPPESAIPVLNKNPLLSSNIRQGPPRRLFSIRTLGFSRRALNFTLCQMNRWVLFVVCAVLGLGLVAGGLFVPIHLRALDTSVVQRAGKDSPSLLDHGAALVQQKNLGAAQLLLEAAGSQS